MKSSSSWKSEANNVKIGILAVQGAFAEHETTLQALGAETVLLKNKNDLARIDGLVLPGGESTAQSKLLKDLEMFEPLKGMIEDGFPTLATCAGLILLARRLADDDVVHFGTLPVTARRNAYGRQLGSFQRAGNVGRIGNFVMTFIRAPYVESADSDDVEILATVDDRIVGVQYRNQLALAFHPEMGGDLRVHEYFLKGIKG